MSGSSARNCWTSPAWSGRARSRRRHSSSSGTLASRVLPAALVTSGDGRGRGARTSCRATLADLVGEDDGVPDPHADEDGGTEQPAQLGHKLMIDGRCGQLVGAGGVGDGSPDHAYYSAVKQRHDGKLAAISVAPPGVGKVAQPGGGQRVTATPASNEPRGESDIIRACTPSGCAPEQDRPDPVACSGAFGAAPTDGPEAPAGHRLVTEFSAQANIERNGTAPPHRIPPAQTA